MQQVHKYILGVGDDITQMPVGAQPLSVAFQGDQLVMWALVDVDAPMKGRQFIVRGTGHNIRLTNIGFIGTAFIDNLVFHVFEIL